MADKDLPPYTPQQDDLTYSPPAYTPHSQQQPSGFPNQPSEFPRQPTRIANQPSGFTQQPSGFTQQPSRFPQQPSGFPQKPSGFPDQPSKFSRQPTRIPNQPSGFLEQPTRFTDQQSGFVPQQSRFPSQSSGFPEEQSGIPQQPSGFPQHRSGFPQQPTGFPEEASGFHDRPCDTPQATLPNPAQSYGAPQSRPTVPQGRTVLLSHGIQPEHGFINPPTTDLPQVHHQNLPGPNSGASHPGFPRRQFQGQQPGRVSRPGFPQGRGQLVTPGGARRGDGDPLPNPEVVPVDAVLIRRTIVIVGQICPTCRHGVLREQINAVMICLAIVFFPIGLLFLLCAKQKKCNSCQSTF